MILVVGSFGSGKKAFVQSLGYAPQDMARAYMDDRPVLLDLHELVRANGGFDEAWFAPLCAKQVVVCDEVGCGVVPIDAQERRFRDEVGRACARLAGQAQTVVRLVCGLPQTIKGQLP